MSIRSNLTPSGLMGGESPAPGTPASASLESPIIREQFMAKQVVLLLHRAYQGFEMYPVNHQVITKFCGDLFTALQAFFAVRRVLDLRLDRFRVYYGERVILEEQSLSNNFIFLLFSNGIRKLVFHEGLSSDECLRFFSVLHRCARIRSIYEDAVTLMWEQDFQSIRYYLVEDLTELFISRQLDPHHQLEPYNAEAHRQPTPGEARALQIAENLARMRLELTDEERVEVKTLIDREEVGLMHRFLEVVSRVLEHSRAGDPAENLLILLGQVQPILLSSGELDDLIHCFQITSRLARLFEARAASGQLTSRWHDILKRVTGHATDEHILRIVIGQLDRNPDHEMLKRAVFRYIQVIEVRSVEPLLAAFEYARRPGTRAFWGHVIARKYRDNPRALGPGMRAIPRVARAVTWILGQIGTIDTAKLLRDAAQHGDPHVRMEALRSMLRIRWPFDDASQVRTVLIQHLTDPERVVRHAAIRALTQHKHAESERRQLMRAVFAGRPYDSWSREDRRLFFQAVVRLGDDDVALMGMLTSTLTEQFGGWVAGLRNTEVPRIALEALYHHPSPLATDAFREVHMEGPRALRKLCDEIIAAAHS